MATKLVEEKNANYLLALKRTNLVYMSKQQNFLMKQPHLNKLLKSKIKIMVEKKNVFEECYSSICCLLL